MQYRKYYSVSAVSGSISFPSLEGKIVEVSYDSSTEQYNVEIFFVGVGFSRFGKSDSYEGFLVSSLEDHSYGSIHVSEVPVSFVHQEVYRQHSDRLATVSEFHRNYKATS
jgi:hypothetical protein